MPPKKSPAAKKAAAKKSPVAKKTAAKKSPVKKAATKKSPVKKATAKKSPGKKTSAGKKTPKKTPVKKSPAGKKTAPKKAPGKKSKESSDEETYNMILERANELYEGLVPLIINPELVDQDKFAHLITDTFINYAGLTFSDFLEKLDKNSDEITNEDARNVIKTIYYVIEPQAEIESGPWARNDILRQIFREDTTDEPITNFVYRLLEDLSLKEGLYVGKTGESLMIHTMNFNATD